PRRRHAGAVPDARKNRLTDRKSLQEPGPRALYHSVMSGACCPSRVGDDRRTIRDRLQQQKWIVQRLSDRRHHLHAERPIGIPEYLTIHDASYATMKYPNAEELDTFLQYKRFLAAGELNEAPATADMVLAGDTLLPSSTDQRICTDYSEEAVPERDPA